MRDRHATALRRQDGFTLVEMVISMMVLVIITAIAVPSYAQVRKAANIRSLDATVQEVAKSATLQAKVFDTAPADRLEEATAGMAEQCDCTLVVDETSGTITVERWNTIRVGTVAADGTVAITDGSHIENTTTTTTSPPATTTTVPAGYPEVVLASDPVAYWPLDGSSFDVVPDMTGNGHDGVGYGKIKTGKNGVSAGAFSFDGNSAFIAIPYDHALAPSGPWTVELWVHRNGGHGYQALVSNGTFEASSGKEKNDVSHTPLSGFALYSRYQGHGLYEWAGVTASQEVSDEIDSDEWTYLVYVYTGAELQLWENGTMEASAPVSGAPANPGVEWRIAAGGPGTVDFFFHGFLDEVAFYDRALTPSEIAGHYQAGQ